jgi:hypothetical protein
MPLLKPRNRSVVFRLTEDEYESLRAACDRSGGRSMSEYARSALLSAIATNRARRSRSLERQLKEIESSLHSLIILVTRFIKPGH